jgi:hypothetical protein
MIPKVVWYVNLFHLSRIFCFYDIFSKKKRINGELLACYLDFTIQVLVEQKEATMLIEAELPKHAYR